MVKTKIGYFGGTFDPIHFGHINLAQEAIEQLKLKEVWFCPTSISPFKTHSPPVSPKHRLKMTQLALQGCHYFKVLEDEVFLNQPARTYETLKILSEAPKNAHLEFTLILSGDLLNHLGRWYEAEKLLTEYSLFIGAREGLKPAIDLNLNFELQQKIKKSLFSTRLLEISSEDLRVRLKKKLYCNHLCPAKVLDYIYDNRLY